jgi:membrane-bound ClpP family serine protease
MNSIKLNRKSWHYRLATVYANEHFYGDGDENFCYYLKCVVAGAFMVLLTIMFSALYLGGVVNFIIGLIVSYQVGHLVDFDEYGAYIMTLTVVIGTLITYAVLAEKHRERKYLKCKEEPGFIGLTVQKIRSKVCFKIELI